MRILPALRTSEWSMKRKLFGYMILLVMLLLLAVFLGLILFGHFHGTEENTFDSLDIQMEIFEKNVYTHFQRLAAASISLSQETTQRLEAYLANCGLSFGELSDSPEVIAGIQEDMMEPLRQKLLQENCSGVFVMLDATVNTAVEDAELFRTGVYLQRSGYKTTDRSILLYRGLTEAGKRHNIMPHRKWRLEFRTDLFPNYPQLLKQAGEPLQNAYLLTERFTLPGTSENAVLMMSPLRNEEGEFYGLCGYEISANYFKTYHAQPTKLAHLTCLLTPQKEGSLDASAGLSCGVLKGYFLEPRGLLTAAGTMGELTCFAGEENAYVGLTRTVSLSPNNPPYTLAAMIPKADFDRAAMTAVIQNTVLCGLILFFAVSCCLYFSRRYLSPILKGLEQIKSENRSQAQSSVPEINDLFAFLAEQDRRHEESLSTMAWEKENAETEKDWLQSEYAAALAAYENAQVEYSRAQQELDSAKTELNRLAYSRKTEIDPEDFRYFKECLGTLTKTERLFFGYYLEGKSAKEILEITGIKEGTLKFHNHNILQKLGVSSRKQMLRYAALLKQEEETESAQLSKEI